MGGGGVSPQGSLQETGMRIRVKGDRQMLYSSLRDGDKGQRPREAGASDRCKGSEGDAPKGPHRELAWEPQPHPSLAQISQHSGVVL